MDDTASLPDPTDWLQTPLSSLSPLENLLHCQICKDFFDTPMITSCAHSFCSKCIRTAISTDGCCPACRTADQASKLRNNLQLQEVVSEFIKARPTVLKVARDVQSPLRFGKRKRVVTESSNVEEETGRTTRSKSRKIGSQASAPEVIEDSDDDAYIPEQEEPDDGLMECLFGCGQRVPPADMNAHLDRCEDEKRAREAAAKKKPPAASRPRDRLSEPNYSMMREAQLAKRMKELGIPSNGAKALLVKRYTTWVNIWNANCDSSAPRSKRDLLKELDVWERTQGGNAPNMVSSIMRKDFDRDGWGEKNQNSFKDLIANARQSRNKAAQKPPDEKDVQEAGAEQTLAAPDGGTDEDKNSVPEQDAAIVAIPSGTDTTTELYTSSMPVVQMADGPNGDSTTPGLSDTSPSLPAGSHDSVMPASNQLAANATSNDVTSFARPADLAVDVGTG